MKRLTKGISAGLLVAVLLVAAAAGTVGTAVAQEQKSNQGVDYYLVAPDHANVSEETRVKLAVYFRDPSSEVPVDTEVTFSVDGDVVDSETGSVAVEQGTWSNTTFTHTFDGNGTYDLKIRSQATFGGQPVSDVSVSGPIAVGNASLDDGAMDGDGDDDGSMDGNDSDGSMDGDGDDDGAMDGDGGDGDGTTDGNGDGGDGLIPQPGFTVVVALAAFLVLVAARRLR